MAAPCWCVLRTPENLEVSMKLLVVGGGGREHAIIRSLKKNPEVETIYALPGNGGIAYIIGKDNESIETIEEMAILYR